MKATHQTPTTWLRTDYPVVPINASAGSYAAGVQAALHQGVIAAEDAQRPGFYEFEAGDNWYYVHIPIRIPGVYLVAAGRKSPANLSPLAARARAGGIPLAV